MVHESDHNPRTVIDGLERENRLLRQRLVRLETGVSGVERMEMLEEQNRLLAAFQQVVGVIHGSLDMEEILDHMATQVLKVGIFRSLTIGVVDEKSAHIDLVRNLLCHTPEGAIAPVPGSSAVPTKSSTIRSCIRNPLSVARSRSLNRMI